MLKSYPPEREKTRLDDCLPRRPSPSNINIRNCEDKMKCLSIRQPWALLLCVGGKAVENRSRSPLYRGKVAIHAGSNTTGLEHYIGQDSWDESLRRFFSFGAIIGVAELFDSVPFGEGVTDDAWAEGPFCLMFRNPRLLVTPIPYKGRLN